jgi:6-phosphogluconolactonase
MKAKLSAIVLAAAMVLMSALAVFAEGPHANDVMGAVYAMTNAADNNEVVMFDRDADGILTLSSAVSTEGTGSGGGLDQLASQGSLVLSGDRRCLLAVNAGSNEISVIGVKGDELDLVDKVDSGGEFPESLTVFHDLICVLNAGVPSNTTGFYLNHRGRLASLDNSTRLLGTGGFAQVGFDPRGSMLVLTDIDENGILVYSVGRRGLPSVNPVTSMSNGLAPFGFIFDQRGNLLVSEAGSGAVSTYKILRNGELRMISPSVANGQAATCWIAGNMRGKSLPPTPAASPFPRINSYRGKELLLFSMQPRVLVIGALI